MSCQVRCITKVRIHPKNYQLVPFSQLVRTVTRLRLRINLMVFSTCASRSLFVFGLGGIVNSGEETFRHGPKERQAGIFDASDDPG